MRTVGRILPAGASAAAVALAVAACTALSAALGAATAAEAQGGAPPSPVIVSQILERLVVDDLRLVGTAHPRRTTVVASETEGKVAARLKEPGQSLQAGEPILRLANEQLAASLIEALADVKLTRFRSDRSAELLAGEAISEDQALEAEYELDRARSRLQDLEVRLEDLTIRAPFKGACVESLAEVGEWVSRGQGVARIVATDTIRVYANVPERYVSRIQVGDEASVTVDALGTDTLGARVVAILSQGDAESRTFPVIVELLNPAGRVRGGMSAAVRFAVRQDRARLLVHKDAIVSGTAGSCVFVAIDGAAAMRPVTTGLAYQGLVAVEGQGLAAGDMAIVRGNERLRDGQAVRIVRKLQ